MTRSHIIFGLDVGTSKVSGVAAEVSRKEVRILGTGAALSSGIKKGIVVNMNAAADCIKRALKETETSSGIRIRSVSATISGSHIRGFESVGAVSVSGSEVSRTDVTKAVSSAKAVYIPLDREVLHAVPTGFIVDGHDGVANPVGMRGGRLEASVHIITGAASPVQNLIKSCSRAGVHVTDIICEPLVSAHCTLTGKEKESGAVLADIGGGTTGVAFFRSGVLRHAGVIAIGGNHLTNDIAVGLKISLPEAERIKRESGAAMPGITSQREEIKFLQSDGREKIMTGKIISEILQPRCEELLELIYKEIESSSGNGIAVRSVVLTGGTSLLKGFRRMAESRLRVPVRIGLPGNIRGLDADLRGPEYAAAVGLITFNAESIVCSDEQELLNLPGKAKYWFNNFFKYKNLNPTTRKEGGVLCLKSRK